MTRQQSPSDSYLFLPIIHSMKAIMLIVLTTIGGWAGWWLGYHWGLFAALVLSLVGTGAGLYYGRRFNQMYE